MATFVTIAEATNDRHDLATWDKGFASMAEAKQAWLAEQQEWCDEDPEIAAEIAAAEWQGDDSRQTLVLEDVVVFLTAVSVG